MTRDTPGGRVGQGVEELHTYSRTNKLSKWVYGQDDMFYGWNFFLRYSSETCHHFEFGFQQLKH